MRQALLPFVCRRCGSAIDATEVDASEARCRFSKMASHDPHEQRESPGWLRIGLFLSSAAAAAAALHITWDHPLFGVALLAGLGVYLGLRWWSKTRLVRMLREGDVHRVLGHWAGSMESTPHAETIAPLMTATAFAAFGRIEDARRALADAARGPAWDAALEHRLFLDVLLSTFEGDSSNARIQLARLSTLPVQSGGAVKKRVLQLREAVGALVRAFDHRAEPGDLSTLESAAEQSPLVHWAMRYAAAIVAVDEGQKDKARALLEGAPRWPEESAFRSFHEELSSALGGDAKRESAAG